MSLDDYMMSEKTKKGKDVQVPDDYSSQQEAQKIKDDLMLTIKVDSEKEQKQLEKQAQERTKVEKLKEENLEGQATFTLFDEAKSSSEKVNWLEGDDTDMTHEGQENSSESKVGDDYDDDDIWTEEFQSFLSSKPEHSVTESHSSEEDPPQKGYSANFICNREKYLRKRKFDRCVTQEVSGDQDQPSSSNFNERRAVEPAFSSPSSATWRRRKTYLAYSERSSRFSKDSGVDYSYTKSCSSANDPNDAPPLDISFWEDRMSKMEEIVQMAPRDDMEEEAMLQKALELSMLQAVEDIRRQKEIQRDSEQQKKYLEENPDIAASLEKHVDGNDDDDEASYMGMHNFREKNDRVNTPTQILSTDSSSSIEPQGLSSYYNGARPKYTLQQQNSSDSPTGAEAFPSCSHVYDQYPKDVWGCEDNEIVNDVLHGETVIVENTQKRHDEVGVSDDSWKKFIRNKEFWDLKGNCDKKKENRFGFGRSSVADYFYDFTADFPWKSDSNPKDEEKINIL